MQDDIPLYFSSSRNIFFKEIIINFLLAVGGYATIHHQLYRSYIHRMTLRHIHTHTDVHGLQNYIPKNRLQVTEIRNSWKSALFGFIQAVLLTFSSWLSPSSSPYPNFHSGQFAFHTR